MFGYFEDRLGFGLVGFVRVVEHFRVKLFDLVNFDKAALVAEALLCQVFPAGVPHFLLATQTPLLFVPVLSHFVLPLIPGQSTDVVRYLQVRIAARNTRVASLTIRG